MDLWFDTFECRMSFPKWIGNHSRYLHWWISSATAPMTWSSKVPQRCPITHVAHASVQAAMFVTWNIKNVFAQKAWTVLNAPNVPNFIIVILEDARNVQDMVLRQAPVGDEEYVKMMRWTRWTRCTRWVPSATLATLDISDPLVIALLLAFVDVFHHLLVLDARNPDVKRILKTPSFDFKKDVFKILSEFCGFDFSAKHLKFFVFAKAFVATLVSGLWRGGSMSFWGILTHRCRHFATKSMVSPVASLHALHTRRFWVHTASCPRFRFFKLKNLECQ